LDISSLFVLLPFALGIFFLLWQEDTIFPLLGCIFLGSLIASRFSPFHGFINIPMLFISDVLTSRNIMLTIFMFTEGIILFTLITKYGIFSFIIKNLSRKLNSQKLSFFISLANVLTFIDRNFSALLVGLFSRPFADKMKLSREKHSYIINTFSSSISTLIPFTTLTPVIIANLGSAFNSQGIGFSPILAYLKSIPYQFYNFFAIFVILSTLLLNCDFLFMKQYILQTNKPVSKGNTYFGFPINVKRNFPSGLPMYFLGGLMTFIFGIIATWIISSRKGYYTLAILNVRHLQEVFTAAFFSAILVVILFIIFTRTDTYSGFKGKSGNISMALIYNIFYIILASAVGVLAEKLDITISSMGFLLHSSLKPQLLPFLIFCLSAVVSFLSGSSILTISTVLPLGIKLTSLSMTDPLLVNRITFATIGAVTSGATFGDTNSPLSLNFIISTVTTEASISRHFKSQIVYSIFAYIITIVCGYVTFLFNLTPYLSIVSGLIVIASIFFVLKKKLLR